MTKIFLLSGGKQIVSSSSLSQRPLRIGCAGWGIPQAAAQQFAPGKNHLERYAQFFNACEINSSFYRPHKIETWERWRDTVPEDFRFSIKAPGTITHESKLNCGVDLMMPFFHQLSFLKEKLGPILFQLPPSLQFDFARTTRFLTLLRDNYSGDVVWEPRHSSWFGREVHALLNKFHIAQVAADPACVRIAAEPAGLSSLVYYRLHGSPRRYYSSYSDDFLNTLAAQLSDRSARAQVWCIFDNTASGSAIQNAMALQNKLASD